MKQASLLIFYWFIALSSECQNLITNGDFETYTTPPSNYGQTDRAVGWNNVNYSSAGGNGSPDYFMDPGFMPAFFGAISPPLGGGGQMGFCTWHASVSEYREYLARPLLAPMIPGQEYTISFMLSNGSGGTYSKGSNNIGMYFSIGPQTQLHAEPILVSPQVEITSVTHIDNRWQPYTFKFIAAAAYDYVTIGNFRSDANTQVTTTGVIGAYYFIDDITTSTIIQKLHLSGDSAICRGSTATLRATGSNTFAWADSLNPSVILSTSANFTVSPTKTTRYFMYGNTDTASFTVKVFEGPNTKLGNDTSFCRGESITLDAGIADSILWSTGAATRRITVKTPGQYSVTTYKGKCAGSDTINLSYSTNCPESLFLPTSFTPNNDGKNDVYKATAYGALELYELSIYNRYGKKIFSTTQLSKGWDGKTGGLEQQVGVYVWMCRYKFDGAKEKFEKGTLVLLR